MLEKTPKTSRVIGHARKRKDAALLMMSDNSFRNSRHPDKISSHSLQHLDFSRSLIIGTTHKNINPLGTRQIEILTYRECDLTEKWIINFHLIGESLSITGEIGTA